MKKRLAVSLLAVSLLAISGWLSDHDSVWQVRANEYFGDGTMWEVGSGKWMAGVIKAWGWYAIYGTVEDCRIVPIFSPVGDAATVQCGMVFNAKGRLFSGWMDFRGHPRPFCGGINGFPMRCFSY